MGRGARHSKNAGVMGSEALTYHEKKAMGYGTLRERLGKDAQGSYFDCSLTLQRAEDPVLTKDGYLFSKSALLEYYLDQKKAKQRLLAEWEAQEERRRQQADMEEAVKQEAKISRFERQNMLATSRHGDQEAQKGIAHSQETESSRFSIRSNEERARTTKSFWQPQSTKSSDLVVDKPSMDVLCPVSGRKVRLKDLVDVKFTPAPDETGAVYMDPVTKDIFTNSSQLVVLRPTGDVMLAKTYRTCIKPDGQYKGKCIEEKDVIKLIGGGTGFAAREGQKLESSVKYTLGPGTGKADLRGQAAGGQSRFGLAFRN